MVQIKTYVNKAGTLFFETLGDPKHLHDCKGHTAKIEFLEMDMVTVDGVYYMIRDIYEDLMLIDRVDMDYDHMAETTGTALDNLIHMHYYDDEIYVMTQALIAHRAKNKPVEHKYEITYQEDGKNRINHITVGNLQRVVELRKTKLNVRYTEIITREVK